MNVTSGLMFYLRDLCMFVYFFFILIDPEFLLSFIYIGFTTEI